MALPRLPRFNPTTPIPNNPFYSAETSYFVGPYYNATIDSSSGISVQPNGSILITGGGGGGSVISVSGTAPVVVTNPTTTPVISVTAASTTAAGIVQLNDSTSSGSSTTAASSLAVKSAYDLAAGALPLSGGTMTGPIVFAAGQTIPITTLPVATTTSLGVVQVGTNISVNVSGIISVASASTTAAGVVQLSDSTSTVSSTTAATSTAVKSVYDLAAAALPLSGGTMSGPIVFAAGQTIPVSAIPAATTTSLGVVQVGTNIDVAAGVISVKSSSTTQSGIVQLNDTVASTSTTEALTAAQGKVLQDQITSLAVAGNLVLAGTFDATASQLLTVTADGTAAGFTVGNDIPSAAVGNTDYFVIVTTGGSYSPPGGGGPFATSQGDWLLSNGTTWQYLNVGTDLPTASTGTAGIVQLATALQTQTGTDSTLAITPSGASATYIPLACLTGKGALVTATGAGVATALPVGTNGQVLAANSACAGGLEWIAAGGGGSVTSIIAGTGLTGGTITSSGTIALANTAVAAGSYTNASITVDAQGRLTAASDGSASVTSVTGTAPIVSSGGATPAISLANTAVTAGSYTYGSFTVDAQGRLTAASSGTAPNTTVTAPITNSGTAVAPVIGIQDATTGQKGSVQIGTNIDVAAGVISVKSSSTTQSGIVQLNNTVASTSTTEALTAAQGKVLQDQITSLTVAGNTVLAGTFDATASEMLTVTADGTAAGFVVGNNLPTAGAGNTDYFVIVTTGGSYNPPGGGGPYDASQGDWFLSNGTTWQYLNVGTDLPIASTGTQGIVQLATSGQTQAGTSTTTAITPSGAAATYIPLACLTAKGTLISATGASTAAALPVGTDGQVLIADSTCSSGLKWDTLGGGATATPTTFGTVLGCTNALNASFGCDALPSVTLDGNTALGNCSMFNSTSAMANTAIGSCSLYCNTTGDNNVSVGQNALGLTSSGSDNVAVGTNAGDSITTGSSNVVIGPNAEVASATGSCQLAIGFSATDNWLTGDSSKAIKPGAGIIDCAGTCGTAGQVLMSNGSNAVCWGTAGGGATSATPTAEGLVLGLTQCFSGGTGGNTGIGFGAGCSLFGGQFNTFIGFRAGNTTTTGSDNVAIGTAVTLPAAACSCHLAIGSGLGRWLTGDNTFAIKPGRGILDCLNSTGTAGQVLISTGGNYVCWGAAGSGVTSITAGTGLSGGTITSTGTIALADTAVTAGSYTYASITVDAQGRLTAASNGVAPVLCSAYSAKGTILASSGVGTPVALGVGTNGQVLTADSTCTAGVKWGAGNAIPCSIFTATGQMIFSAVGNIPTALAAPTVGQYLTANALGCPIWGSAPTPNAAAPNGAGVVFGATNDFVGGTTPGNTFLGRSAGGSTTGCCNVFIGLCAGNGAITGSSNVFIGPAITTTTLTSSCCLMIGFQNGCCWLTGNSLRQIKPGGGILDCVNSAGLTGQALLSTGLSNAVCWGTVVAATCFTAKGNLLVGTGSGSFSALPVGTTPGHVLQVDAACATGVKWAAEAPPLPATFASLGTVVGISSTTCCTVSLGCGSGNAQIANSCNTYLGILAGAFTSSGNCNVMLGHRAGIALTVQSCNTLIGFCAGAALASTLTTEACNNIIIGNSAQASTATATNEITLGNAAISCIRSQVQTISSLSDSRDKTNVTALPVGLGFINTLNPVKFTWQNREPNPTWDGKADFGFLAQELKAAQEGHDADYLQLVSESNPDRLEASYGRLLPVMVKAIQELSAENKALRDRLDAAGL